VAHYSTGPPRLPPPASPTATVLAADRSPRQSVVAPRTHCLLRWPSRSCRPEGGALGRAGTRGGSDDGGREELAEVCPSRASSSRIRSCRAAFCTRSVAFSCRSVANSSRSGAGSGAGTGAQRSGASGSVVSIMPLLYRVPDRWASPPPRPRRGMNAYRKRTIPETALARGPGVASHLAPLSRNLVSK
jgi:hypothetical protein